MTARPNFAALLADIRELQDIAAARLDTLADLREDVRRAAVRLDQAELSEDRRLWSEAERSEYRAADFAYQEALAALVSFEKANPA